MNAQLELESFSAQSTGLTLELARYAAQLGLHALDQENMGDAHAIFEWLAISNPKDPVNWMLLAEWSRRNSDPEGALACARIAVELAPQAAEMKLMWAEALLAMGHEEATEQLEQVAADKGPSADRAKTLLSVLRH